MLLAVYSVWRRKNKVCPVRDSTCLSSEIRVQCVKIKDKPQQRGQRGQQHPGSRHVWLCHFSDPPITTPPTALPPDLPFPELCARLWSRRSSVILGSPERIHGASVSKQGAVISASKLASVCGGQCGERTVLILLICAILFLSVEDRTLLPPPHCHPRQLPDSPLACTGPVYSKPQH